MLSRHTNEVKEQCNRGLEIAGDSDHNTEDVSSLDGGELSGEFRPREEEGGSGRVLDRCSNPINRGLVLTLRIRE